MVGMARRRMVRETLLLFVDERKLDSLGELFAELVLVFDEIDLGIRVPSPSFAKDKVFDGEFGWFVEEVDGIGGFRDHLDDHALGRGELMDTPSFAIDAVGGDGSEFPAGSWGG